MGTSEMNKSNAPLADSWLPLAPRSWGAPHLAQPCCSGQGARHGPWLTSLSKAESGSLDSRWSARLTVLHSLISYPLSMIHRGILRKWNFYILDREWLFDLDLESQN